MRDLFSKLLFLGAAFFSSAFYFSCASTSDTAPKNPALSKYSDTAGAAWGCHDPKIFQDPASGIFYVYSTGWNDGVQLRKSHDLVSWTMCPPPFYGNWDEEFVDWVSKRHSWAPTVTEKDGLYYMFHGIITDSLSTSTGVHPAAAITLAIAKNPEGPFIPASKFDGETYKTSILVRYVWTNENAMSREKGFSACFNTGRESWNYGFGCIDPEFVMDIATGNLMEYTIGKTVCHAITYGSWKGGIALAYVDAKTFKPVNQTTGEIMDLPLDSVPGNSGLLIAGGAGTAYEGSQLIFNSDTGWYYVFVSMSDLTYEYRVGVGRSKSIEGPYLDASNRNMNFTTGGIAGNYRLTGSKIIGAYTLGKNLGFMSPGGQSVLRSDTGRVLFANHTRTTYLSPHQFVLQVHRMFFNGEGWPVLDMNDFVEERAAPESLAEISGAYDVIITERSQGKEADSTSIKSRQFFIDADGNVTGAYKGKVEIGAVKEDGAALQARISLEDKGDFDGFFFYATNMAGRKKSGGQTQTLSFTALNNTGGKAKGEYIFGNSAASN